MAPRDPLPEHKGRRRPGRPPIRMAEVAQLAGVSPATVSRVMRSPEAVSPLLRGRVQGVANRLGYSPNPIAGSLSGAHSPLIGVIVPTMTNAFFSTTLEALSEKLEVAGYQLMVGFHEYDENREESVVAAYAAWRPAALVVTGVNHSRKTVAMLSEVDCPVVEMWDIDGRPLDTMIGYSNYEAGVKAAEHFLRSGRRKLACVNVGAIRDPRAAARFNGFYNTARAVEKVTAKQFFTDGRGVGDGNNIMKTILFEFPAVDGIFFIGDAMATGAIFETQRQGVRVPDDIAIIGFGDLEPSAYVNPSLTTIRPPHDQIGNAVADHLLQRFKDPKIEGTVLDLGFRKIIRSSA